MKRPVIVVVALFGIWACGDDAANGAADEVVVAADTLTRAQKDSVIATLPIPGGSGIGAARRAVDLANARVEQHDTIR